MTTSGNISSDHYLKRDEVVYSLDKDATPRLTIDPNKIVTVETHDARGGRLQRPDQVEETTPDLSHRFPKANPATGPIYVRGAEPGDSVTIEILGIEFDQVGFILVKRDMGVIRDLSDKPIAKMCRVADGEVHFGALRFPVRPMVGVVGVAPAGEAIGTLFVGDHGGNMDMRLLTLGSKLTLRAQVPGALLYIGDVHAAMGDGEVTGTGIEIGGRVTVRIDIDKKPAKRWPRLETPTHFVAIASAPTFEAASEIVVRETMTDVGERLGLSPADSFMLIGAVGDLAVNQACHSTVDVSVRLEMPRWSASTLTANTTISYPSDQGIPLSPLPFSPVTRLGNLLFVSGQASVDGSGNFIEDTFEGEMRRAIISLQRILGACGCGLAQVLQTRNYVQRAEDVVAYNRIYREYFAPPYPARTTITNCLPGSMKYEIECIAIAPT